MRQLIALLAPLATAASASPFGTGVAGFEIFPGGRILADFRAAYRWQWDAPDRYPFRVGISLAVNSDWWDSRSGGP
ncbi:MAG TPA: hypothetical protein VK459_26675 [Polyangiaceae bacterium]|nr:hypothetical protein [Polyangiaceae bacterium]